MLTLPPVHPFLMALLTERSPEDTQLARVPLHSWDTIVEEAIAQRIIPFLLRRLNQSAHQHQVPSHLLTVLKQQMARHTVWQLLLTEELRHILAACEQKGIACIPIRGPVLAEHLYGDGATRQMDDLDFLIHRGDLSAIKDTFRHLNYALHEHRPGFQEAFSYSLEFIHPHHGFLVEPHWTLTYPPFIDTAAMEPVWARAKRQPWAGIDTWTLSHEDLLLHLCLHLHHKGRQSPLLWFCELDTVIRRHKSTLDWKVFTEQVLFMQQADAVTDVLAILKGAFHSPIPDSVVRQLTRKPSTTSAPSSFTLRSKILDRTSSSGREELQLLCSLQSLHQQRRYLSALIFPSPQYMTRRYGTSTRIGVIGFYIARFFHIGAEVLRCAVAWIGTIATTRPSSSTRQ